MDFIQLEAYVNVFELKNFSNAAKFMHISQPSISAYIKSLENELGVQLIYRSTKEFLATKYGEEFYKFAKDILALKDNSINSLKQDFNTNSHQLRIVASSVPAQYILPKILGKYKDITPNILFDIEQIDTAQVIDTISSYNSDIGFVGAKIENSSCIFKKFLSEELIIITPYHDKYLNFDSENILSLFQKEHFVAREKGSGTRLRYENYLTQIGFMPENLNISAKFSSTQGVIQAVANGLGISIISKTAAQDYIEHKRILGISNKTLPKRNFYIVINRHRILTSTVKNFLNYLHTYKDNTL